MVFMSMLSGTFIMAAVCVHPERYVTHENVASAYGVGFWP